MVEETSLGGGDRVSIDKDSHEFYRDIIDKATRSPESGPFYLMKDVFMWAVALGAMKGTRKPIKKREQIFRWDQLSQDIDIPVLQAIGIAETGDVDVIGHEDQLLRIAEEYANGGITQLKREIKDGPGQALWNLLDIARSHPPSG